MPISSKVIYFFSLNKYQLTRSFYGSLTTVPLRSNDSDRPVTLYNREEYVKLYLEYELMFCIKEQFQAFLEGFRRVCDTRSDVFVSFNLITTLY